MPATKKTETTRRFEFIDGNSCKFWEIRRRQAEVIVCYGRIGSTGQTTTKPFADETAASRHAEKLSREKTGKGYVEVTT